MPGTYEIDLQHALRLADIADAITTKHYLSNNLRIETKPDSSPVTQADLEVEEALSAMVVNEFNEGYVGEEGKRATDKHRVWVVDPIDATKNYMRNMPFWGSLIALTEDGIGLAAVVSAPAMGRRWWATKGGGARTRDVDGSVRQLRVTGVAKLSDAFMLSSSMYLWDRVPIGQAKIVELINSVWRWRALGDFLNYVLVAEGAADFCVEPTPRQWDLEAPKLILEEAGGKVWTNALASAEAAEPRIAIATNGYLEKEVLEKLNLL